MPPIGRHRRFWACHAKSAQLPLQEHSMASPSKPVVLTGDRTTGPLHLGHYVGSLRARVALQEQADQYILLADTQALTDNVGQHEKVARNVIEVASDYLAVGIDPAKSTVFIQSQVPELAELTVLLMNFVTVARLQRNPTIKEESRLKGFERDTPAGFLTYPVSQAADIAAFRATVVPVGEDQVPMIEQTNELVRRFNASVGADVLVECAAQVSATGRLPGVDGRTKMSKSLGNTIELKASPDAIRAAVRRMYTDKHHLRVIDPGQVEGNVVFAFLDAFDADTHHVNELKSRYRKGGLGDAEIKRLLEDRLQALLAPIRAERQRIAADPGAVMEVLKLGTERARQRAASTVGDVKRALGLSYFDHRRLTTVSSNPTALTATLRRHRVAASCPRPIEIRTLGSFEILRKGERLRFERKAPKRALQLLQALIAFGGQDVAQERLADALWPDSPGDEGINALSTTVSRLRKLLDVPDAVMQAGGRLTLNPDRCSVDAFEFEKSADASDDCESGTQKSRMQRAFDLYRGGFLDHQQDASWAVSMRERLRRKFALAIGRQAHVLEVSGDMGAAIPVYLRGIDADELSEEFYRGLMRCYERLGRRAEAMCVFRQLRRTLSVTLGICPSNQSQVLFESLRNDAMQFGR
jgi:tryptophanyl-tRNA synthetase